MKHKRKVKKKEKVESKMKKGISLNISGLRHPKSPKEDDPLGVSIYKLARDRMSSYIPNTGYLFLSLLTRYMIYNGNILSYPVTIPVGLH